MASSQSGPPDDRDQGEAGTAQEVFRGVLSCVNKELHQLSYRRRGTRFETASEEGWYGSIAFRRLRASTKRRLFFWIKLEVISEDDGYAVWQRLLKELLPVERLPSSGYEVMAESNASEVCDDVVADLIPFGVQAIDLVLKSHDAYAGPPSLSDTSKPTQSRDR